MYLIQKNNKAVVIIREELSKKFNITPSSIQIDYEHKYINNKDVRIIYVNIPELNNRKISYNLIKIEPSSKYYTSEIDSNKLLEYIKDILYEGATIESLPIKIKEFLNYSNFENIEIMKLKYIIDILSDKLNIDTKYIWDIILIYKNTL